MYTIIRIRFLTGITRESYWYRETPRNPSSFYSYISYKICISQIHFTLINIDLYSLLKTQLPEDRQPLTCTLRYRLLLSNINFWHRCRGVSTYSRDNSVEQGYRWITLLVISFHFLLILFSFSYCLLFVYFVALIYFVLLCMSDWVRNSKGRLETFEAFFGSLFDTLTSSITVEERVVLPEAPRMTMYQLLHPT